MMVMLHIKSGCESQFLYEASVKDDISQIIPNISAIYNGRLKVHRLCDEIEELGKHGLTLPTEMQGLLEEQLQELHLTDESQDTYVPSGGTVVTKDPLLKRNGQAPCESMQQVLIKTVEEAKAMISKVQVDAGKPLNQKIIKECLDILRGAVTIVYPMGLPPHEPIKMELENAEEIEGTQAAKEIIEETEAQLWFANKELKRDKKLCDFVGNNEKTKVIVKITKQGKVPPPREPAMTEEERKAMMLHAYKRQEQLKELKENDDDSYLDSQWADKSNLKKQFHGLNSISWKP